MTDAQHIRVERRGSRRDHPHRPPRALQLARRGDGARLPQGGPPVRARRGAAGGGGARGRGLLLQRRGPQVHPGRRQRGGPLLPDARARRRAGVWRRLQADPRVPAQRHLGDPARAKALLGRGRRRGGGGRLRSRHVLRPGLRLGARALRVGLRANGAHGRGERHLPAAAAGGLPPRPRPGAARPEARRARRVCRRPGERGAAGGGLRRGGARARAAPGGGARTRPTRWPRTC